MIRGRNVRGIRGLGLLLAAAGPLAIPSAASADTPADARVGMVVRASAPAPAAFSPPRPGETMRLSAPVPSGNPTAVPTVGPAGLFPGPAAPAPEYETGVAEAAVAAAVAAVSAGTELAVAVLDRATGETTLGPRADEPIYTASLSKVVVAVDILERRRIEGLVLDPPALDQLRRALSVSDDSAMSALWSRFDGAGAPARLAALLGLQDTRTPADASQWGEVRVSARDYLRIYDHIAGEMSEADRALLLDDLGAAPAFARDGFAQDFGLLAPAVAGPGGLGATAKQGWMCCFSGEYYLHSAGLVGPDQRFVVALLSVQPRSRGWADAREELTTVATALAGALT
ncbi:MAG: hypothetical protein OJJ54_13350 [Pseudonocardia sp.]|nr:hypothetical protein [Pseudonocardia sp.]